MNFGILEKYIYENDGLELVFFENFFEIGEVEFVMRLMVCMFEVSFCDCNVFVIYYMLVGLVWCVGNDKEI